MVGNVFGQILRSEELRAGGKHLGIRMNGRRPLTLILLTWRIRWAPNNAGRWQMGFNLAFRRLILAVFAPVLYLLILSLSSVLEGPGSSVGIATAYGLDSPGIESRWGEFFRTCPDRPWGPPSLLYNGYRVFSGGKVRPRRDADPSPPSSAEV